jgi:hypothetical protein
MFIFDFVVIEKKNKVVDFDISPKQTTTSFALAIGIV